MRKIFASLAGTVLLLTGLAFPISAQAVSSKVLYLTFDDGPSHPEHTRAVLYALAKYNAKATFFMVGDEVVDHPRTFARVVNAGHSVQNHTWGHEHLPKLTNTQIKTSLLRTQKALGVHKGKCFRAPYGDRNARVDAVGRSIGLRDVLWDITTHDYKRPPPSYIANHIVSKAFNGANVLLHDGGGDGDNTAKALHILLPKLKKMGYTFKVLPNC